MVFPQCSVSENPCRYQTTSAIKSFFKKLCLFLILYMHMGLCGCMWVCACLIGCVQRSEVVSCHLMSLVSPCDLGAVTEPEGHSSSGLAGICLPLPRTLGILCKRRRSQSQLVKPQHSCLPLSPFPRLTCLDPRVCSSPH